MGGPYSFYRCPAFRRYRTQAKDTKHLSVLRGGHTRLQARVLITQPPAACSTSLAWRARRVSLFKESFLGFKVFLGGMK